MVGACLGGALRERVGAECGVDSNCVGIGRSGMCFGFHVVISVSQSCGDVSRSEAHVNDIAPSPPTCTGSHNNSTWIFRRRVHIPLTTVYGEMI
jgi:hypothetical protein